MLDPTRKPIPKSLGSVSLAGGTLTANQKNTFSLKNVEKRINDGHAIVTKIVLVCTATIGTLASDSAIASYLLPLLMEDFRLTIGTNMVMVDRQGYHHSLRDYLQHGTVTEVPCADIPATGGGGAGSYSRTFAIVLDFVDEKLGPLLKYWRCMPAGAMRDSGVIEFKPKTTASPVVLGSPAVSSTATFGFTALSVEVIPYYLDFPAAQVPIGACCFEGYKASDREFPPGPLMGQFARLAMAIEPTRATIGDDVSSGLTRVEFGTQDKLIIRDRDPVELVRQWNEENCRDPRQTAIPAAATVQEQLRFLDPTLGRTGHSARLHALPLFWQRPGHGIEHFPNFVSNPTARLNNGNSSGLPTSYDWIFDKLEDRTPQRTVEILKGIHETAVPRIKSATSMLHPNSAKLVPISRQPVFVDLRGVP